MIRNGAIAGPRRSDLERIKFFNRVHIILAGMVPLLGVLLISLSGVFGDGTEQSNNVWMVIVSGGGLLGVIATSWLWRRIEVDAQALGHLAVDESRGSGAHRSSRARSSKPRTSRPKT